MDGDVDYGEVTLLDSGLPAIPPGTKPYFTADIDLQLVSIITNDWPYSSECARSLLVSRLLLTDSSPFIHRALPDMDSVAHFPP